MLPLTTAFKSEQHIAVGKWTAPDLLAIEDKRHLHKLTLDPC